MFWLIVRVRHLLGMSFTSKMPREYRDLSWALESGKFEGL